MHVFRGSGDTNYFMISALQHYPCKSLPDVFSRFCSLWLLFVVADNAVVVAGTISIAVVVALAVAVAIAVVVLVVVVLSLLPLMMMSLLLSKCY